ncbi:MAG: hypothetical protein ACKO96_47755, partial [Flammeovirgaceae bacterium]
GKQLNLQFTNSIVMSFNKIEIGSTKIFKFLDMVNIIILKAYYQIKRLIIIQPIRECFSAKQHNNGHILDHMQRLEVAKIDDSDENKINAVKLY